MGNLFTTDIEIHERFDLKGSTHKRTTHPSEDRTVARKDLDFNARGKKIKLGYAVKSSLMAQMEIDCDFFTRLSIIDYSLLVGIHKISEES